MERARADWIARCAAFIQREVPALEPTVAYGMAVLVWPPNGAFGKALLQDVLLAHGVSLEAAEQAGLFRVDDGRSANE